MEVRRMREEDLDQVVEIENQIFSKPWSYESFKESLGLPNAVYLVCENNKEIIGYCGMYCILDEGDITNMAVKEQVRNKGIGYMLLCALVEEAKERDLHSMTLEVRRNNPAAFHLYKQLGFKPSGIRKNFYQLPTEDAVIMWKHDL